MGTHSKKTPEMHDRMIALHSEGSSANAIAEALGVKHPTVLRWLREAGLEPNGHGGRPPSVPRQGPTAEEKAAALTIAQGEQAALRPTADVHEALDIARRRHAEVSHAIDVNYPKMLAGQFQAPLFKQLLDIEQKLALQIRDLTPQEPPDPERDPLNLDAAGMVHRRLQEMVTENEADLTCCNCGKHPYRKSA